MLTPHEPLIKTVKIDETENWCPEIRRRVKRIFGVYLFDARRRVHCCEIASSHELHFVRESQAEFHDETTEEEREEIARILMEGDAATDPISYIHCSRLDNAPEFDEGFLPQGEIGVCKVYNSHRPEERKAEDEADAAYDDRTKEEWESFDLSDEEIEAWKEAADKATAEAIEEAMEYSHQNCI